MLRARPDLVIVPQRHGCDRYWLVKDPVALKYFHLRDEEHALLRMLDGRTSLSAARRRFEAEFAPLRASVEQIHAFLGRLHEMGLLLAEVPGQGRQLIERRGRRQKQFWFAALTNVLAIRLPGIDPVRLLRWLYPKCRWMFSAWFLGLGVIAVVAAAALVLVQFVAFRARLPALHAFLTLGNVVWLMLALAVVKVLHELGHALTCKHFGGDCHEIGVLLLFFTPCLYCNVSDAWLFPGKWPRIAVSAAGIAVELFLATIATFLWWFSAPGVLNTLCLNIMIVCSLSTLLINGNPLLRYDGYYVLADLLDVPNLGQQSRWLLGRLLAGCFLGSDLPPDRTVPRNRKVVLFAYGVASMLYGWLVVLGILWLSYRLLEPRGLKVIAQILATVVIAGAVAIPVGSAAATMLDTVRRPRVRPVRAVFSFGFLAVLLVAALLIPLPYAVHAPVVIESRGAQRVYVAVPGRIEGSVSPGDSVVAGQELARLVDLDIRKETEDLAGQRRQMRLQLADLRVRLGRDPSVAGQIPAAEASLADVETRLRQREKDEESLVIRAPVAGTVLPPPPRESSTGPSAGQLPAWQGSPLDSRNRGCQLQIGTLLCEIGSPAEIEAILVIDQAEVNRVRTDQRVRIQLDEKPGQIISGTVVEVAKIDLKVVPRELAARMDLPVRIDDKGQPHPLATAYQARVRLDDADDAVRPGTGGRAKVLVEPQSLGQRFYQSFKQTF